ncbi:hypothetical protein RhiirC2_780223 [Rhizophagus irregularis]|uniref:SWIM-type domain-containing protein n=1 Tax=Rhizophagus irregularis TaxID=588596 RepID=A0A2N1N7W1_9GLOM|nr:hypothetical protein RhiirC2_780223 [Rhizophagus irregularis]
MNAFYGHSPQVRLIVFLTDDSAAEHNVLELCWPNGIRLLYIFHFLTQTYNPIQVFQFITINIKRFYERRLLRVAHKYPGTLCIAKRFLYPGWEKVDANSIQKTNVANEFLVPNTKNNGLIYVINNEIGVYTCPIRMSGALCKHQEAVSIKFHISIFNFISSLTPDDHMIYTYITLNYVAKNKSFYILLYAQTALQNQEIV